jgi:hypothetical protein
MDREGACRQHGQQLFGKTAQLHHRLYARILDVDDACRDLQLGGNLGEQMAFGVLLRQRQLEYDTVHDSPESLNSRKQRAEGAIACPGPRAEIAVAQVNAPPNRGEALVTRESIARSRRTGSRHAKSTGRAEVPRPPHASR